MIYVIQGNYGCGWEDVTASDDREEAKNDLRDYRLNQPEYPHRMVKRKGK